MDECKKFQWSKFSEDRSEQFVIRTENWQELVDYRVKTNVLLVVKNEPVVSAAPIAPAKPTEQAGFPDHVCSIHNTPMIYKEGISKAGKPYKVWSCGQKLTNGSWCDQKEWVK